MVALANERRRIRRVHRSREGEQSIYYISLISTDLQKGIVVHATGVPLGATWHVLQCKMLKKKCHYNSDHTRSIPDSE